MKFRRDVKLARFTVKLATIGLAGYGAQQLWVRYGVPITTLAHDASRAVETQIAPAVQDAAESMSDSGKAAVAHVKEATRDAVGIVVEGAGTGEADAAVPANGTGLFPLAADPAGITIDARGPLPTDASDRPGTGTTG